MKKYSLSIAYVLVLTLSLPLACLYLWLLTILPIPWESLVAWADTFGKGMILLLLFFLPVIIYGLVMFVLGVANIGKSFKVYRSGDVEDCINRMLILKYGLVVFFIINFIVMSIWYFLWTVGALVGTRGLVIFAAPVLLPFLAGSILLTVTATWLATVPGAFYSIQVIRFTLREKKIGLGAAVWHGVLQFVFLADVLDAMYLAVKKWNRGKKSSVVIGILYILMLTALLGATIYIVS